MPDLTLVRAAAALPVAALVLLPVIAASPHYPEEPPPQHTGGFGEPTCHTCHFGADLNAPGGKLELLGLPEVYEPDRSYRLIVRISRADLMRAGYQLAARYAEGEHAGEQAGQLRVSDVRSKLTPAGEPEVTFAHHTREGSEPATGELGLWELEWQAPHANTPIVFHLAANAANGDASEFGDHVYTRAYVIPASSSILR